jgi:hypothetical protein
MFDASSGDCMRFTLDCLRAFCEFGLVDPDLDLAITADEVRRALGPAWELGDVFEHVLEDNTVSFIGDAFNHDGDHAAVIASVAEATGGAFHPEALESSVEPHGTAGYRVSVRFREHGQTVTWHFNQPGDSLPEAFLRQLREHTARRTEMEFVDLSTRDFYRWVCLPKPTLAALRRRGLLSYYGSEVRSGLAKP